MLFTLRVLRGKVLLVPLQIQSFVMPSGTGKLVRFVVVPVHYSTSSGIPGLYTSPHLVAVRERIRIGGKPLSEEEFSRYFFEVWDRLQKNGVSLFYWPAGQSYLTACVAEDG